MDTRDALIFSAGLLISFVLFILLSSFLLLVINDECSVALLNTLRQIAPDL